MGTFELDMGIGSSTCHRKDKVVKVIIIVCIVQACDCVTSVVQIDSYICGIVIPSGCIEFKREGAAVSGQIKRRSLQPSLPRIGIGRAHFRLSAV